MTQSKQLLVLFAMAFAFGSAPSHATPILITPNSTVTTYPLGGTSVATEPLQVGPLVYDTGILTLSAPTFNASFVEGVFHDANNTLCANCLTFAYQLTNLAPVVTASHPQGNAIEHFTTGSFTGYTTAVGYVIGTGGDNNSPLVSPTDSAPVTVDESLDGTISFNFDSILFNPVTGIQPNDASDIFYIETNAQDVQAGNGALIDSSSVNVGVDVPALAATPEPSSLVLLGSGLVGAAGMMYRRRRIV